jgi:CheY-like chemotaxis protein
MTLLVPPRPGALSDEQSSSPDQARKAILVVEDNVTAREGMVAVLDRAGYRAVEAADGEEAIDYLANNPLPSLVLLDMLMPQHDGWEFLGHLRGLGLANAFPIVITTGVGNASLEWARSLGAASYFSKPINVEALLLEVGRLC